MPGPMGPVGVDCDFLVAGSTFKLGCESCVEGACYSG